MRIKPFQATYPNFDFITSVDGFFDTVKEDYQEYRKGGFFKKAFQDAIYIYRITDKNRSYTGIIACADINEYLEGKIKKHENTLPAKEQQQLRLMVSRDAVVKPVLLTYTETKKINDLVQKCIDQFAPFYSAVFEDKKQKHTFWEISDGQLVQEFEQAFASDVPVVYIADGHHRTSTSALMHQRLSKKGKPGNTGLLLSAFFPTTQLAVHDYNRVVDGLSDTSLTNFMAKISQLFEIEILKGPEKPTAKHQIVMFVNREWFSLKWKTSILQQYENEVVVLDANMLDEHVITTILGIQDVRTDARMRYVEGPKGLSEVRKRTIKNENCVGFLLFPASLDDLMKIADAGKTMPPKSTWFEPRIKNGLLVLELELDL